MTEDIPKSAGPGQPASVNPTSPGVVVTPPAGQDAGTQNPFPYVVAFVIAVLAVWGLMTFQSREEEKPLPVQAHAPAPVVSLTPIAQETVATVAIERVEKPESVIVEATGEEGQTVVVETVTVPASSGEQTLTSSKAKARTEDQLEETRELSQPIEVVDLDYSAQLFPPLDESELDAAMTQLDADIDATEETAAAKSQSSGLEILEERFDALEDRRQAMNAPLSQADRTTLTRQIEELRAELSAFQKDLAAL